MSVVSATRGVPVTLLAGVTTGVSNPIAIPPSFNIHNIRVVADGSVSGGSVQIESANDADYTGAWNLVTSPISLTSASEIDANFNGIFTFLRVNIAEDIVGGATVTVDYVGS